MKTSMIIPFSGTCKHRRKALTSVLKDACAAGLHEIIVVESGTARRRFPPGVVHVTFPETPGAFCKAEAVNRGALAATGKKLWIHDADLRFTSSMKSIAARIEDQAAIMPMRHTFRLNASNTRAKINGKPCTGSGRISDVGAGSVIVDRALFLELRGFNERFTGWGCEDVEFGTRLLSLRAVARFEDVRGIHLWHPSPNRAKGRDYRHNLHRRTRAMKAWKRDQRAYTRDMPSCIPVPEWSEAYGVAALPASPQIDELLPYNQPNETSPRVALLMMSYGASSAREGATKIALDRLRRLDPMPSVYFCELTEPGQTDLRYIPSWIEPDNIISLPIGPQHAGAWQKEAVSHLLANKAIADGAEIVVFLDPDSFPVSMDWITRIETKLAENPQAIIQPWSIYSDTIADTHRNVQSYCAARAMGQPTITRAPGLAWAMTSTMWRETGGFNEYLVPGGGDCEWVLRIDPDGPMTNLPFDWPWWVEVHARMKSQAREIDFVEMEFLHVNHGAFDKRAYNRRNVSLVELGVPVLENLYIDDRGLLAIRNTPEGEAIRHCMKNKSRMLADRSMMTVVVEAIAIMENRT